MKNSKYFMDEVKRIETETLDFFSKLCKKNNWEYYLIGGTLLGAIRHNGFIPWDDDIDIVMPRKDYNKMLKYFKSNHYEKYFLDCYSTNKKYWLPFVKIRVNNTEYVENFLKAYNGHNGIWIDIFPLDNGIKENFFIHKFQQTIIKKLKGMLYLKNIGNYKDYNSLSKKAIIFLIKLFPNGLYHFLINFNMKLINWWPNTKYYINYGSQYGILKQTHLKDKYKPARLHQFEDKKFRIPNDYNYILRKIYGLKYMELPPIEKRITHNPIRIKLPDGKEMNISEKI